MLQRVDTSLIDFPINTLEEKVLIQVIKGENAANNCACLQHRTGEKVHSLLIMGFRDIKGLMEKIHQEVQTIFHNKDSINIEIYDSNLENLEKQYFNNSIKKLQKK